MIELKKVTFEEAILYIKPVLRHLHILAIPFEIDTKNWKIIFKIPRLIPK
jgi:hypothetical protein